MPARSTEQSWNTSLPAKVFLPSAWRQTSVQVLSLAILSLICGWATPALAQDNGTNRQTAPTGGVLDPSPPEPPSIQAPPDLPANPEDLFPTPSTPGQPQTTCTTDLTFLITDVQFEGNTLFDRDTLEPIVVKAATSQSGTTWSHHTLPCSQLVAVALAVTEYYHGEGYAAAGAVVTIPEETGRNRAGPMRITINEGSVDAINITGMERLVTGYARSRLGIEEGEPLNTRKLQERLQLLQFDPLIQQVRAALNAGAEPNTTTLDVTVTEADSTSVSLGLNNSRPSSVGTDQSQIFFSERNLLGWGDALTLGYSNTRGSDAWSFSYSVPINADNGTFSFSYSPGDNDIISDTFFDLNRDGVGPDIESRSDTYEVSLRQPLLRSIEEQTFHEVAIGLTGSLRESQTFLLDEPFPLSAGASSDGITRVAALRFFQEYTLQDGNQALVLRSRFSFGLNALNSTINDAIAGVETIPDSRFFTWLGQFQWVRVLAPDTVFILKSNLQFADQGLLSAERFGIGGISSVRGYSQDRLLTDNAIFASAELRIPIARIPELESIIQVAPFIDFGKGWNHNPNNNPDPNSLISMGLGLQWQYADSLTARLDWGIPLIDDNTSGSTWQDNGLYFSLVYTPF